MNNNNTKNSTAYIIQHIEGGYLRRTPECRWERISNKAWATRFTYEKAEKVLSSNLGAQMRKFYKITVDDGLDGLEHVQYTRFNWNDLSQAQHTLFSDHYQYKEDLRQNLSEVDLEICDIQHYIEFFSLDAAKGYKA